MRNVVHRFRQFWRAMRASVEPQELTTLAEYLNPAQRTLFRAMTIGDQRHSLDLFYALRATGDGDEALLQAALLHDVGKSQGHIRLWQRIAYVLLGRLSPRVRSRFCASPRQDWRYPFYVLAHHMELGADLAARAGCHPDVVALILHHQAPPTADAPVPAPALRRLSALQAADDD